MKMHIIDLVLLVVRMAGVLILGLLVFFLQTSRALEGNLVKSGWNGLKAWPDGQVRLCKKAFHVRKISRWARGGDGGDGVGGWGGLREVTICFG